MKFHKSRLNKYLFITLIILTTLLTSGCWNQSDNSNSSDKNRNSNPSDKISRNSVADSLKSTGDWIIAAVEYMPESFDPYYSYSLPALEIVDRLYDGLLRYDSAGKLTSGLAESWNVNITPSSNSDFPSAVITFKLQNSLKWSDGSPIQTEQIVKSLNNMIADESAPYYHLFRGLEDLKAASDGTIVAEYSVYSYSSIHSWVQPVRPPGEGGEFGEYPGTGPFRFHDQPDNGTITLEANPYYRYGKVTAPGMVYRIVQDQHTRILMIATGQLDLAMLYPHLAFRITENKDAHHNVVPLTDPACAFAAFNCHEDNKRYIPIEIREKLASSIDRNRIVDEVFHKFAEPVSSPLLDLSPWLRKEHTPFKHSEKNVGEKFPSAVRPLEIITGRLDPDMERMAMILSETWSNAGIETTLRLLEEDDFQDRLNNGDFDIYLVMATIPLSNNHYDFWASDGSLNFTGLKDSKVDAALHKAELVKDDSDYGQSLIEFEEALLKQSPAAFILRPQTPFAVEKRFSGVMPGTYNFSEGPEKWRVEPESRIYGSSVPGRKGP